MKDSLQSDELKELELRSDEVQEILSSIPNWIIRWGSILFLALILTLLFLLWLIKYPDVIQAEAVVTTVIPPEKIQAQISGKLDTILVKNNQDVNPGEILAILENSANYEDVYQLKSIIDSLEVQHDVLQMDFTNFPILFLGDIEAEFSIFENNLLQFKLFKKINDYSKESNAMTANKMQLEYRLRNFEAQKRIRFTELTLKKKDLDRHEVLYKKGVISKQELEAKQIELAEVRREYTDIEISMSEIEENLNEVQKDSSLLDNKQIKEEVTLFTTVIQSLDRLKKAILDWEKQNVLKSNIKGRISFLNHWYSNQNVNASEVIFTIIPGKKSPFIGKLKAPKQNSGNLLIGQKVLIQLENYPEEEYGFLQGIVENISKTTDVEGFYVIDVKLPPKMITSYNKEIAFKQEMSGTAEIITKDFRLIDRLWGPLKKEIIKGIR